MFRILVSSALVSAFSVTSHAAMLVTIDDFSSNLNDPAENSNGGNSSVGVLQVFNPGATVPSLIGPPTTSADDTNVGILGGTRQTTLTIANTPAAGELPSFASTGSGGFNVANATEIDTDVNLVYNGSGAGLNQDMAGAASFTIDLVTSDVVPFDFTVTVSKQGDATTASTLTESFTNAGGGSQTYNFILDSFTLASGASTEFDFANDLLGEFDFTISGPAGYALSIDALGFAGSAIVPEPSRALLSLVALGAVVMRRRR